MKNNDFYNKQLYDNDNDIEQVGWHDIDKAIKRYEFAKFLINQNGGGNVVDVGCGLGTLYNFIQDTNYIGIDLYQPYINMAKVKYPDKFYCGVLEDVITKNNIDVDHFISLGAYTIIDESINNVEEYVFNELRFMLNNAKKSVIVNGFHNVVDSKDYKYYHDLNNLVKFSHDYTNTHTCSLHIFSKYEFFLQLNFVD